LNDWLVVWQSPKSTIRLASATKFSLFVFEQQMYFIVSAELCGLAVYTK